MKRRAEMSGLEMGTHMERRMVLRVAAALAAPGLVRVRAQTRMRRVGVLNLYRVPGTPAPGAAVAWKKLGWIEGETLRVERRYAENRLELLPELADDLLRRQQIEVLITEGAEAAVTAARLTTTVPIVFTWAFLPVEGGLIDSYARPGRNCTGVAFFAGSEVIVKRLELLRAIAPSARRVAYVATEGRELTLSGAPLDVWRGVNDAIKVLDFEHTVHFVNQVKDVEPALQEAAGARAQIAMITGPALVRSAARVAEFALHQRWLTATLSVQLVEAGLLLHHGLSNAKVPYHEERVLQMADRILRGANPAEIPVEIPTHMDVTLNLKTARALGLALPQSFLLRVDRVIE